MRYKLVIAEKPSAAQSLAAVIGATARKDGYLEGNGWRVSWCVGHLAGLADADSYDPKYAKWRYDDLPILPEHWQPDSPTPAGCLPYHRSDSGCQYGDRCRASFHTGFADSLGSAGP